MMRQLSSSVLPETGSSREQPRRSRAPVVERVAGWSARHRKTAVLGWLVLVAAVFIAGQMLSAKNLPSNDAGQSGQAEQTLQRLGVVTPPQENVLIQPRGTGRLDSDRQMRQAVRQVVTALSALPHSARDIASPLSPGHAGLVAGDGRTALVTFHVPGKAANEDQAVAPALRAVATIQAAHPGLRIQEAGDASTDRAITSLLGRGFRKAEATSVPITLVLLLLVFGALVAAGIPLLLAITSVMTALSLLTILSRWLPVGSSTSEVVLIIGMAVGVDYSLFYLRREREERAAGRDKETALRIAASTSGHSILISGLTVMVAMAGMFLSGMHIFEGFAMATILVVAIAMLGSVTVLPALLSMLGDRVEFGRLPGARRRAAKRARRTGGGKLWNGTLGKVSAHPRLTLLGSAGFLILLAGPAFGLHTAKLDVNQLVPQSTPIVQTYDQIVKAFPSGPSPATVVVKASDINGAAAQQAITAFQQAALRTGELGDPQHGEPIQVTVYQSAGVAKISVPLAGNGADAASVHALNTLRNQVVPQTLDKLPGAQVAVGGRLAFGIDFNDQLRHSIAPVFLFVLVVTFLLMLIAFRSAVIAATAIALNLLSVGAAYGVMTAIFQHGWGASLVHTQAPGAIESWLPLFVFVVLFGLSMDYHVFVVSRIKEARERGMTTERAVMHGLRAAAGTVTSAAVIMVAVFGVFGTLSMQDFKQLGVGLAVAVALDATVIRILLLPAVMILLGERNWSRSLRRRPPGGEGPGQGQPQDGPAAGVVGGRHAASVRFGDLGDDGEAEARAGAVAH
jgi:RND superfamily putative drug exporter